MLCLLSHVCSVHASEAICILQAAAWNVFGVGEDPAHVKFHILSESGPCFFRRVNNTALRICATPLAIFGADEKMSEAVDYSCKATAKPLLFEKTSSISSLFTAFRLDKQVHFSVHVCGYACLIHPLLRRRFGRTRAPVGWDCLGCSYCM